MDSSNAGSLSNISLLSDLSSAELERLSKQCTWLNFAAGEQVLGRNADGNGIYFVVAGRVRIVNFSISGREITFDERSAGSYFGEISALDGEPRSANVIATGRLEVAQLSQNSFNKLLIEFPQVTVKLLLDLSKIIRISNTR
ncbi:MAG: cyclic nucleotide-binding domain-containing protein, partial [Pseudomonadota bacterium]|nr:cyclic nucleotide-binding domain-containing protein [Pseudomonadota bacterium]